MNKKISLGPAVAIMFIVAAVSFSITMVFALNSFNNRVRDLKERENMYQKFTEIDRLVRLNYFGDINETTLLDSVAEGYVAGIDDEYATYITAEDYQRMTQSEEGENVGIGAVVTQAPDDFYLLVGEVYADSPAQVAGIEEGDLIVQVDETDLTRENSAQMLADIEGPQGTTVNLLLRRGSEEYTASITRRSVAVPTVYSRYLEDSAIGYITIREFGDRTYDQFNREYQRMIDAGAKSLVFDLRDNPGGTLRSATRILDKLLPAGVLVSITYKDGTTEVEATSDANEIDLPMVVLINSGTASSAEIFAQSIRDFDKGRTVGSSSMGKGVVQDIIRLSDGSAIELTVGYYQTYSGATFNEAGIKPDYEVSLDGDWANLDENTDPQLMKAIEVSLGMQSGTAVDPGESSDEESEMEEVLSNDDSIEDDASGSGEDSDASDSEDASLEDEESDDAEE